mgnify:CR=1 FL=1
MHQILTYAFLLSLTSPALIEHANAQGGISGQAPAQAQPQQQQPAPVPNLQRQDVNLAMEQTALVENHQTNKFYLISCGTNRRLGAIPGLSSPPTRVSLSRNQSRVYDPATGATARCQTNESRARCKQVDLNSDGSATIPFSTQSGNGPVIWAGHVLATAYVSNAMKREGTQYTENNPYGDQLEYYMSPDTSREAPRLSGELRLAPRTVQDIRRYQEAANPPIELQPNKICVDGLVFNPGAPPNNATLYVNDVPVLQFAGQRNTTPGGGQPRAATQRGN